MHDNTTIFSLELLVLKDLLSKKVINQEVYQKAVEKINTSKNHLETASTTTV